MKRKFAAKGEKKGDPDVAVSRRKRVLKVLRYAGGSVAALLLVLLIFRDFIIRRSITAIASRVTGVEVTLDELDTSLFRGSLRIGNFRIANPKGYDEPYLLQVEHFFVDVDLLTLFSRTLVIESIHGAGISAVGAIGENGKLNLSVLNEHVQQEFPPDASAGDRAPSEKKPAKEQAVLIRRLLIENSSATLREDFTDFSLPPLPLDCEKNDLTFKRDQRSFAEKFNDFTALVQAWSTGALHAGGALVDAGKSIVNQGTEAGQSVVAPVADFFKNAFSDLKR